MRENFWDPCGMGSAASQPACCPLCPARVGLCLGEGLAWAQPEAYGLLLLACAGKKPAELGAMPSLAGISHANELGKPH